MALETLKGLDEIGGYKVIRGKPEEMGWDEFDEYRKEFPIHISEHMNTVSVRIQDGPIKEVGVNGAQLDTLVEIAVLMIKGLNAKFPCRENSIAVTKFEEGLMWLDKRKKDREKRGVEGHNKA